MGWRWIEPRIWNIIPSEEQIPPRRGTLSDRTKRFFVSPERQHITEIHDWPSQWYPPKVPHYSTEIAAAWEVVERLHELNWSFHLDNVGFNSEIEKEWRVCLLAKGHVVADGESAPEAICRAALAAVGEAK